MAALARQLDIIADTALREDPRLAVHTASSTVHRIHSKSGLHTASSTVAAHPDIAHADRMRLAQGRSHAEFCRLASIETNNWHKLRRGEQLPSPATLRKIAGALAAPEPKKPRKVIAGFHRLVMGLCADAMELPRAELFAADFSKQRPQNAAWLAAARVQMMATYITAVELEVGNAELGRALGQTRQAVQKARNRVEDLRDIAAIDAALVKVTAMVSVEG